MIAPTSSIDLDDSDAVQAADSRGVLHSAALAGAQVRATAAAVREGALDGLDGLRPRSIVMVASSGRAWRGASLATAALGGAAGVPLVHVTSTPAWVGPLDVVIIAGDDAGDPRLAQSIAAAVRRRAEVIVAAPDEGPVRDAASGRARLMPPRMRVLDRNTLPRFVAVAYSVLTAVDTYRADGSPVDGAAAVLDALADRLDAEAVHNHPSVETFHNPAKSIAARSAGRRVLFAGDGAVMSEVGRHASEMSLRSNGSVTAATDLSDVIARVHEGGSLGGPAVSAAVDFDPLFHDDELDGPRPGDPVRVFVLSMDRDEAMLRRRVALLGDVDIVRADMTTDEGSTARSEVGDALIIAARFEAAAAYSELTGG